MKLNPTLSKALRRGWALAQLRARRPWAQASSASSSPSASAELDNIMDKVKQARAAQEAQAHTPAPTASTPAASSTAPTSPAAPASSSEFIYEPLETDFPEMAGYTKQPDESGPTYTDLGNDGEAHAGTGYPGNVTPFTDEEIFDGTLQSVLYGYDLAGFGWRSEQEINIFAANFTKPPRSPVSMPFFISKIGIGKALARYGIGHGMAVEQALDRADDLPPWVILVIYAGVTFGASYLGMEQVKRVRQAEAAFMDGGRPSGAAGPDVGVQEGEYAGV